MKRIGLVLCLGAACLAFAATAGARASSHPTSVFFDDSNAQVGDTTQLWVSGHVTSPSPNCVANRTVKLFFGYQTETAFRLVDVTKSSRNGEFGGVGPETRGGNEAVALKLKVLKKKFGPKHHRQTCNGASTKIV